MMRIVNALPEHAAAIAAVERAVFAEPWSERSVAEIIASPAAVTRVCEEDGYIVWYYSLYLSEDRADVNNLAVAPAYRGRGHGKALMRDLTALCDARGADCVLDVRESNAKAIALYEKFGFRAVGRRKKYYGNTEDAMIMERRYSHSQLSNDRNG